MTHSMYFWFINPYTSRGVLEGKEKTEPIHSKVNAHKISHLDIEVGLSRAARGALIYTPMGSN